MKTKSTVLITVLLLLAGSVPAATWNVPGDSTTIQGAINMASYGDTVQVAAGTYWENITLKNGVALIGDNASTTTIDGTDHFHVVQCVNGEDPNTILEGFTITGGNADGTYPDNYGGGMYNDSSSPTVIACTFSGNWAASGGGMYNYNSSSPTVTGCTFTGNTAGYYGGGMYNFGSSPTVTNCILWGDSPDEIDNNVSSPSISYSDIEAGYTGTGNINEDPNFINAAGGNLRLSHGSACIDAGDNSAVPAGVTTDLDGNPRFVDDPATVDTGNGTPPIVDMGAYENSYPHLLSPNGGEILPAGSTCTISWQTSVPIDDIVVEYSTAAVPDLFDTNDESGFTYEDSHGVGGSFLISGGKLKITTGNDNTASVMTSQTIQFDVGQTLSLDVPPVSDSEAVFMMCSTTAGQPHPNYTPATFGFRFRRGGEIFRVDLLPGDSTADTTDPNPGEPATLKVVRLSGTDFSYGIVLEGQETYLGLFTLPELEGIVDLHIGAQAYDLSSDTFIFDNLRVSNSADSGAVWQTVRPPNQGNTGSYDWLVPDVLSETCLVRISPAGNLAQSDISDDFFSTAGLAAHWKLDETGGVTATDSTGGNHGSVYGQPQWLPIGGQTGGALQLDGVDDYVDCGNGATLNITDQITLAAWIKTADSGNGQHNPYIIKGDFTYGLKHQIQNNIEFMIYEGNNVWSTVWYPVDSSFNDQWHHVAGTYDGNDLTLYIDGALEATSSCIGSINVTAANVNIGKNADFTGRFYEGLIDDVRIYNYALSADEIRQLLCLEPMKGDLDNNCRTDLADMALWAADWMRCGMAWEDLCWEQ